MDWQPIETAPKDGRFLKILCPSLRGKDRVGFWRKQAKRWGYVGGTTVSERLNQPTHWKPCAKEG